MSQTMVKDLGLGFRGVSFPELRLPFWGGIGVPAILGNYLVEGGIRGRRGALLSV